MINRDQYNKVALVGVLLLSPLFIHGDNKSLENRIIKNIIFKGNTYYPSESLQSKIPYKIGDPLQEEDSNKAIKELDALGHFSQIVISKEESDDGIIVHITLTEKPRVESITFSGNKVIKEKDLFEKVVSTETLPAAQEAELKSYARKIALLYQEKGYHFATIVPSVTMHDNKMSITFTITEGPKTTVKRVLFEGNLHMPAKKLRTLLFTKEDWLLGMLERAGMYHPAAIEQDKMILENFYQSNGYLKARISDARVELSDDKKEATVTFVIDEGEFYTVDSVEVPGNDIYTEEQLKRFIPLTKGQPYSRELIRLSIENLKKAWGDQGYINADVEPAIQPHEENHTVSISFHSDLGKKIKLNRVTIKGNKKSRDRVIRRQLLVDEGEYLATSGLDATKERIKGLGYFDPREGVNWKITRLDEESANLDILLKEVKTGRFELKMNYGGGQNSSSPSSSVSTAVQFTERNLFGTGIIAHTNIQGSILGDTQRTFTFGITEPWLFDKPLRVGIEGHYELNEYEEIRKVTNSIKEQRAGFVANVGYMFKYGGGISCINQFGFDNFKLFTENNDGEKKENPEARVSGDTNLTAELQTILNDRMKSGKLAFWQCDVGHDTINHPVHPSNGYRWIATSKIGIPLGDSDLGFYKLQFDTHWYTPIINETDLVLHLHAHVGYVNSYKNYSVPFKELYNIGGPRSVRGWTFGQISPVWAPDQQIEEEGWQGDPIGGRKAFFLSSELIFPITKDLNLKGCVFYDGGSGWDTPVRNIDSKNIKNNSFDYRHSIGFGIRMLSPQPMKIDWAFKLDKRPGEKATEISFSTYYDF